MENKYQRLIASYDKIIKNLILEYECWKMCASFYSGEKICFSKKGTSTVITSLFRKLSNPGSLTILEILTLILYQIETDTFNESIPLLLCLLSEEQSCDSTPTQSYTDFSNLRNYVGRLILDLPMPSILKLLTTYSEETSLAKKVELFCQNIDISSKDEIANATLEHSFLLALNLNKRTSNLNYPPETSSSQKATDKNQQSLLNLAQCLPSKTKQKQAHIFSSDSEKSSYRQKRKGVDSLSTQTGSTFLDMLQDNGGSKVQSLKGNETSRTKQNTDSSEECVLKSNEESRLSYNESFVESIGPKSHSISHTKTQMGNTSVKNNLPIVSKKSANIDATLVNGRNEQCQINDKSASDSKLINTKQRKLHNDKGGPSDFTPHDSERTSLISKKANKKKLAHLNKFFKDKENHISGDNKNIHKSQAKRKKDLSQSSSSSQTSYSKGISTIDFSESDDFSLKPKKQRRSPRQRGYTRKKKIAWSLAEEEILVQGVEKFGVGQWKNIIRSGNLNLRSVRDCYDKWKNIIKYGHLQNIKARIKRKHENEKHS